MGARLKSAFSEMASRKNALEQALGPDGVGLGAREGSGASEEPSLGSPAQGHLLARHRGQNKQVVRCGWEPAARSFPKPKSCNEIFQFR